MASDRELFVKLIKISQNLLFLVMENLKELKEKE